VIIKKGVKSNAMVIEVTYQNGFHREDILIKKPHARYTTTTIESEFFNIQFEYNFEIAFTWLIDRSSLSLRYLTFIVPLMPLN